MADYKIMQRAMDLRLVSGCIKYPSIHPSISSLRLTPSHSTHPLTHTFTQSWKNTYILPQFDEYVPPSIASDWHVYCILHYYMCVCVSMVGAIRFLSDRSHLRIQSFIHIHQHYAHFHIITYHNCNTPCKREKCASVVSSMLFLFLTCTDK
jgi:hypothetical protein